ncbi:hypothetical protein AK830_g2732 [Neonectria ditissima]|uniref:Quinate/shikimate 5-dehydrogenase/glutamyl-tRNA reductase domain-containing protein n=1 Tax=Neonectria ditissima TaxID=78410 RepID=A0A0P7BDZ1_9HYPO|nr:hypothetical protein AK830_g2732 [Neonectria ditissima]
MDFSVLSDRNVKFLLVSFGKGEIASMTNTLEAAFSSYSIDNESQYQPHRQAVARPDGQITLFMPATLSDGVSVKIVGVPPPQSSQKALAPPLRGVLVLCDEQGKCIGIVNSEEFTAFRTALGSVLLYRYRTRTEHIVMFGAGKQALWHLRLALVLKGSDVQTVTIVNRSATRVQQLIDRLHQMDDEGSIKAAANVKFTIVDSESSSTPAAFQDSTRAAIEQSDVIFCTTPSKKPIFPAEWLTSKEGRRKTRYISAIGSYKLDMQEIDPTLLQAITTTDLGSYDPGQDSKKHGGVILVDSREACALEAGEIAEAKLSTDKMLELGELVNLQKTGDQKANEKLEAWLADGLVLYKGVGLGIMDLALGKSLLDLARERDIGSRLDEF